jgi:hypothetical protein
MASEQSALFSRFSATTLFRAMGRVPAAELSAAESASTLFRFFRSKHVMDLKVICAAAFLVLAVHFVIVVVIGFIDAQIVPTKPGMEPAALEFFTFLIKYVGAAIPIYGIIVGWAYQSASTRLGIVDLFGCEISTLCRVGTIFDVGRHYVEQYDNPPPSMEKGAQPADPDKFVSQEDYFPVFGSNARDLQVLEASVVCNITEFYTYMKATRDTQRILAGMAPSPAAKPRTEMPSPMGEPAPWHAAMANVIYMLFLGYESGRKAVKDLIEFQPSAAENMMVILLTELKCYSFLCGYFAGDELRYGRLQLREQDYREFVPRLYRDVMASHTPNERDWCRAVQTAPELARRYQEALREDMTDAVSRIEREDAAKRAAQESSAGRARPSVLRIQ